MEIIFILWKSNNFVLGGVIEELIKFVGVLVIIVLDLGLG